MLTKRKNYRGRRKTKQKKKSCLSRRKKSCKKSLYFGGYLPDITFLEKNLKKGSTVEFEVIKPLFKGNNLNYNYDGNYKIGQKYREAFVLDEEQEPFKSDESKKIYTVPLVVNGFLKYFKFSADKEIDEQNPQVNQIKILEIFP